jgi:hypothetical protein
MGKIGVNALLKVDIHTRAKNRRLPVRVDTTNRGEISSLSTFRNWNNRKFSGRWITF